MVEEDRNILYLDQGRTYVLLGHLIDRDDVDGGSVDTGRATMKVVTICVFDGGSP